MLRGLQLTVVADSLVIWFIGTRNVPVDAIDDWGLINALPLPVIGAMALLAASIVWLVATDGSPWLIGSTLVVFVLISHALGLVVESEPAFVPAWVHMGFADHVLTTGRFAPELDARFSWPGFFAFTAFLKQTSGLDLRTMAMLSNGLFSLLNLVALAAIVRSFTRDWTALWLSLLLFALGNWIGQEYFAPQALVFFLYLSLLALILTWLRSPGPRPGTLASSPPPLTTPAQRGGLLVVAAVLAMAIVASHPLTPFVLIASLGALTLIRRITVPSAVFLVAAMTMAWIGYVAWPFVSGHLFELLAGLGELTGNIGSNVSARVAGSPAHQAVVFFRLAYGGAFLAVAVLWLGYRWLSGQREILAAALLIAPFPLVALGAYGGELLLRTYLFALPWISVLIASGLAGLLQRPGHRRAALLAVAVVIGLLVPAFLVARYGNERLELFRPTEVEATRALYAMAPPGSLLVGPTGNLPWLYRDVTTYDYVSQVDIVGDGGDFQRLVAVVSGQSRPTFVILTRSEAAFAELILGVASSGWSAFEAKVAASDLFDLVYSNADAAIYELRQ